MRRNSTLIFILGALAAIGLVATARFAARKLAETSADTMPAETLDDPARARRVAEDLVVLAQTLDWRIEDLQLAWLPDSALTLKPAFAHVDPDGAELNVSSTRVYRLARADDDAGVHGGLLGTDGTATWALTVTTASSDGSPKELARVTLPRKRTMPMKDFVDRAQTRYAKLVAKKDYENSAHMARVAFALRFQDHAAARELLVDSIARAPKRSEPRVALALLDAADERGEGIRQLEEWAQAAPDFRKLSYVALAYVMTNRTDNAITALRAARKASFGRDDEHVLNEALRALAVAEAALAEGRLDAAIEMAEFAVDSKQIGDEARRRAAPNAKAIRAAATYRRGDHAAAAALVTSGLEDVGLGELGSTQAANRKDLATAVQAGDDAAVAAWRPMIEDLDPYLFDRIQLRRELGLDAHVSQLVVAPHPDDEALMAGGKLALLSRSGESRAVVIMTNGDYECIVDGLVREAESVAAMARVGVRENRIHFLGYPDGLLSNLGVVPLPPVRRRIGLECGHGNTTYGNRGAKRERGKVYTRENAVSDLVELLRKTTPEHIIVSHPSDTHPDHATTYALLMDAVKIVGAKVLVHKSMVHNGDCWPMGPKQAEPCPDTPVDSAEPLPNLSGRLSGYEPDLRQRIDTEARRAKVRAIAAYDSQTRHGSPDSYLFSYARGDEMFFTERFPNETPPEQTRTVRLAPGRTTKLDRYRLEVSEFELTLFADRRMIASWPLPHDLWRDRKEHDFEVATWSPNEGLTEMTVRYRDGVLGAAVHVHP